MGVRPVDPGAPVADRYLAPASQRLGHQEQVAHPTALVLVVLAGWPARRQRVGWVDLGEQLAAGLIQADLVAARIIGPGVDPKHVLHPPAELAVLLGRDAPAVTSRDHQWIDRPLLPEPPRSGRLVSGRQSQG